MFKQKRLSKRLPQQMPLTTKTLDKAKSMKPSCMQKPAIVKKKARNAFAVSRKGFLLKHLYAVDISLLVNVPS